MRPAVSYLFDTVEPSGNTVMYFRPSESQQLLVTRPSASTVLVSSLAAL